MEYLHNKSFNNLYGVADWLIISGLNAILPCASSFIKNNIHVCFVFFVDDELDKLSWSMKYDIS